MFNLDERPLTGKELRDDTIRIMGEEWVLKWEKEYGKRIDELSSDAADEQTQNKYNQKDNLK